MFTGIVRQIGKVVGLSGTAGTRELTVSVGPLAEGLTTGDSVAIAGACLTATSLAGQNATFDVAAETLSRTTLGQLRAGDRVNLERALRAGEGLDGHIVQGHVDGLAELRRVRTDGQYVMEFSADRQLTGQMVSKGSVAIDGVSLSLVDVEQGSFSVALVPATLGATTLADLSVADKVNVEVDILGKYVRKYLAQLADGSAGRGGGLTLDKLMQAGFE